MYPFKHGWVKDLAALGLGGPPSHEPPDEGWAEKAPTPFRVLQWSAERAVLNGWMSLPVAAGEP